MVAQAIHFFVFLQYLRSLTANDHKAGMLNHLFGRKADSSPPFIANDDTYTIPNPSLHVHGWGVPVGNGRVLLQTH